ncbi:MAG: YqgE/AlgH family protein [Bacteroidia bacterium]
MTTSVLPSVYLSLEGLRPGSVLISRKKNKEELLNKSVVLILEHDETGSTGIVINKPAIFPDEQEGAEPLHYGGTYETHRVGILLNDDSCEGRPVWITDGLFYCERCELLNRHNFRETLIKSGLKAFIGLTVWQAGELEQEIASGNWWMSEFTKDLLAEQVCSWERMTFRVLKAGARTWYGTNSPISVQ